MRRAIRTLNTLKYLKLSQVLYRIYYQLSKPKVPCLVDIELRNAVNFWESPLYQKPSTEDGRTFSFLGQSTQLNRDWNSPLLPKLWLYNLHYQDDLNAIGSSEKSLLLDSLIDNWINGNPVLEGNGWEPYCISLRSINWIKWFCRKLPEDVSKDWLNSLKVQIGVLEQLLERHILANHLFTNAKALVFAGAYFGGNEGERWLKKGVALLDVELDEQFLQDGGHYERSPMYHAILLWDIADLINLARLSQLPSLVKRVEHWSRILTSGMSWQQRMIHPDKGVSFFNDSTFGIAPTIDDLWAYAEFLELEIPEVSSDDLLGCFLSKSGYCSVDLGDASRLIADVGSIGPDYQPGHAHADTLSCELSLFGQRVFVNSGISQYGDDAERHRQRSTAAHNTIEVDGYNSSEVWAGFRVARRAYPVAVEYLESGDLIRLSAAHTGYRRLKGKVTHHRAWEVSRLKLGITDRLDGHYKEAVGFWHLHPNIDASLRGKSTVNLSLPSGLMVVVNITGAQIALEDTTWHPGFGKVVANKRIVFNFSSPKVITKVSWINN